jgi:hypothetical protein
MKATTKVKDKGFEPIELTVTIETKEEFDFFWGLFNSPTPQIAALAERYSGGAI